MIKKKFLKSFLLFSIVFILGMNFCYAESYVVQITGTGVNLRSGPGTNYDKIMTVANGNVYTAISAATHSSEKSCSNGWYSIYYNDQNSVGYVCSDYAKLIPASEYTDPYYRPWTSPKLAIMGGAKNVSEGYIAVGQDTLYLHKFNVNPYNTKYSVYNHQYMENLQAPYAQSIRSFRAYRDNGLLAQALEFTIPVFLNMESYYPLPGESVDTSCGDIGDPIFEAALVEQGFPDSYKCKLRLIHKDYPNWVFKALHTGLDFDTAANHEKPNSSIQGKSSYFELPLDEPEKGWFRANIATVKHYLDPRNFLVPERIFMFEKLSYSPNYTESVVQTILNGTFMEGISVLDNQIYSSIFVEAGKEANVNPVYLASLSIQEVGTKGSFATTGKEFTYKGKTYSGLFNFFNIGAYSSEENPLFAGLVWAGGGASSVVRDPTISADENVILQKLGATKNNGCLVLGPGLTLSSVQSTLGLSVSISGVDGDTTLKTTHVMYVSNGTNTYTYTLAIKGDVDGNGEVGATDYVKIKNYIMGREGSELGIAQSIAADVDGNGEVGATDYVKIKNSIMER